MDSLNHKITGDTPELKQHGKHASFSDRFQKGTTNAFLQQIASNQKGDISGVMKTNEALNVFLDNDQEDLLIEEIKKDEWPKNPIDSSRIFMAS